MSTLLVAVASFVGFIVAYNTYGRWLGQKIFKLDDANPTPSHTMADGVDYVPTAREVVFGHHFTSIAGTGPIVGPAIAVFWGWLPALLWVLIGSIFIGAVHDFGSMVISIRNRGQTIGEVAGRLIHPRAKVLFLLVLFFALTVVIGIFGLVIAVIFATYPESVLSVWIEIPLALAVGYWVHKKKGGLLMPSIAALVVMYVAVVVGTYAMPITLPKIEALGSLGTPVVVWTAILLVYAFIASVLPVGVLLQPRDYINSHQLFVAMGALMLGLLIAGAIGGADIQSAPAIATDIPADAPPIWPFLFITIACGACSGFHCLVSSGTTSKQLECETDARAVGYGSMLLEGALATVVILACSAGLGLGVTDPGTGTQVTGRAAWQTKYQATISPVLDAAGEPVKKNGKVVTKGGWANMKLPQKLGAFVEGGANFLVALGFPLKLAIALLAVLVASFAATTLDTATRLQRYVIQELSHTLHIKPFKGTYAATGLAVVTGAIVALIPGPGGPGTGGLILWPLFGATNQLLAGLALLVISFYLWRRGLPVLIAALPAALMLFMPGWAMIHQIFTDFLPNQKWHLLALGILIEGLQVWMIVEAVLMWPKAKGVLEEGAAPLSSAR